MAENQQTFEIEQALTGLGKLMKALRFYPPGHPSLQTAINECMANFKPMLDRQDNRAIQANQNGFSLDDFKIGENNPALPDLARMLAERRVNQLIFMPDLPATELVTFIEGLTTPAEEIYRGGGLPAFLSNHRVTAIWLNESSLDGAAQKRRQLTEELERAEAVGAGERETEEIDKGAQPALNPKENPDLEQQLREIIEQLNTDLDDDDYGLQIDKLTQLAPAYFEQTGLPGPLRILPLLLIHNQQEGRSRSQRSSANAAIDQLLTEKIVDQILAQFKRPSLTPQQYQRLQKFTVSLGVRIAPQLLDMMSKEGDATVRKRLSSLLGKMGAPLLALLREMTHNSKWYVVRNAVTLLGDIRLEAGIDILNALTTHPDQRVRRALIRSLAMIGGNNAVSPLLKLSRDPATSLRRPAVKALGATRSAEAVRPLLSIAQAFDPFGRRTEMRSDAVAALAILGKKEAIPPLLALAKHHNLLRLQRLEEFRAQIILTLGKLGDKNLHATLNQWRHSPHVVVQRAAALSMTALAKKNDNPSAN